MPIGVAVGSIGGRLRLRRPRHSATLNAAGTSNAEQRSRRRSPPSTHSPPPVFMRDERPLRREHDAEDQQHQRAADVDHQLHRADEVGPGQEEQARPSPPSDSTR